MTIWLLAILLLASLAGLGYRQGGIRVAFSLVGILLGALLARPLGHVLQSVIMAMGLKNPLLAGLFAPVIAFIVISIIFKGVAFPVHQKVDVHFKYHAGDLRLVLWERVHRRVGLCLALFNGTAYLVLICWIIYALSYWTYQTATTDQDPTTLKILNRLGKDLNSSGFAKVARAIDPLPESYYGSADVAGLIYNNSLLEARLARYPAFLGLAEKPEIQTLATDTQFAEMRQRRAAILELVDYPGCQAIIRNPDLMKTIAAAVVPNLADLKAFLETGRSQTFSSEQILGRWYFDLSYTMILLHRARPNASALEIQKLKRLVGTLYSKTVFIGATANQAFLKNLPKSGLTPGAVPTTETQNFQGEWKGGDGKYIVTLAGRGEASASVEGERLTLTGDGMEMAFDRED